MPDRDPRQRPDDTGGWPTLPIEWDEAHDVRDSAAPLPSWSWAWREGERQEPVASER